MGGAPHVSMTVDVAAKSGLLIVGVGTRYPHSCCSYEVSHIAAGAKLLKALRVRVTEMNFPRVDVSNPRDLERWDGWDGPTVEFRTGYTATIYIMLIDIPRRHLRLDCAWHCAVLDCSGSAT